MKTVNYTPSIALTYSSRRAFRKTLSIALPCALIWTVAGSSAQDGIIQKSASASFKYKYEMNTSPSEQDLDANGSPDWFGKDIPSFVDGKAVKTKAGQLFRGDFSNADSIWRALVSDGAAADWTMEIRVAKLDAEAGSGNWFGILVANRNESKSSHLFLGDDQVTVNSQLYMEETAKLGNGSFNTIRIAHDAKDNAYYFWVNNVMLNRNFSTPIEGTSGSSFDNSIFIGDYSPTAFRGNYAIDYIRLDPEAYAPLKSLKAKVQPSYVISGTVYTKKEVMASLNQVRKYYGVDKKSQAVRTVSALRARVISGTFVTWAGKRAILETGSDQFTSVLIRRTAENRPVNFGDKVTLLCQPTRRVISERMGDGEIKKSDVYQDVTLSIQEYVRSLNSGISFRGSKIEAKESFKSRSSTIKY